MAILLEQILLNQNMCLLLLGRLKDQQANSMKFAKANMCLFLLGRLKDQQANSTKLAKAKHVPIPARSTKG